MVWRLATMALATTLAEQAGRRMSVEDALPSLPLAILARATAQPTGPLNAPTTSVISIASLAVSVHAGIVFRLY